MRKIALCLAWASIALAQSLNGIIAVVNDEMITNLEFEKALERAKVSAPRHMSAHPEFKAHILDQLITESLEVQTAKLLGIDVTDTMVDDTIRRTAADNGMQLEDFEQALRQDGISRKEFAAHIYKQLMISGLHQQQLSPKVNVSEFEVKQKLNSQNNPLNEYQNYDLEHFMVQKNDDIVNTQSINSRVKAYILAGNDFESLKKQFIDSPAVKAQSLGKLTLSDMPTLFAPMIKDFKSGKLIGPIENDSGYHYVYVNSISHEIPDEILDRFRTASYKKILVGDYSQAQDIYERLKSGVDISSLSVRVSEHTDTPMENIPPRVKEKLIGPGVIEPINYGGQWVIVIVDSLSSANDLDKIAFTLTQEALRNEKYRKVVNDWHLSLLEDAHIETYIDAQSS